MISEHLLDGEPIGAGSAPRRWETRRPLPTNEVLLGNDAGLRIELKWLVDAASVYDDITLAQFRVWLGETVVWGEREPVRAAMADVLYFLQKTWSRIEFEEVDPLGLDYVGIDALWSAARQGWEGLPKEEELQEISKLEQFEAAHDLSRAFLGHTLPRLWLRRVGQEMWMSCNRVRVQQSATEVLGTLRTLGDVIAGRLRPIMAMDPKARMLLNLWEAVECPSLRAATALSTGLAPAVLDEIEGDASPEDTWELSPGHFEPSELLVVARLTGGLRPRQIRIIIDRIRNVPKGAPTREFQTLSRSARATIDPIRDPKPYMQGHSLAAWLRTELRAGEAPVDPIALLAKWKIDLADFEVDAPQLDAIGCWGPKHGPCVLVNRGAERASGDAGRRSTVAHEIAHLLVDRGRSLPMAEVFGGGRTPREIEKRANAFAAEFLLPKRIAGSTMAAASDPQHATDELTSRYRTSREIVAWQVKRSGIPVSPDARAYLRNYVPLNREY